jgi:uncharacterized protein YqjF (DUF2071 family)
MANGPVDPQPLPRGRPVMRQRWLRLLFLHWPCDATAVQAGLPAGLTVDTWEGRAWLGLVPFKMERVRLAGWPPLPGVSDFLEMNVRTYVRDERGRPGVWFHSLDCAQPLAVWAARVGFGLPYFCAEMRERAGEEISYACRRRGEAEGTRFRYRPEGSPEPAREGSFEQFLVERYRLFAMKRGRLVTGEVWHEPYRLQRVRVSEWSDLPLRQAGFAGGRGEPEHAVFSPGVDARIFGVESVRGRGALRRSLSESGTWRSMSLPISVPRSRSAWRGCGAASS